MINASNKTVNSTGIVTLTGVNQFNSNWDDGLDIRSYGAITVSNITADNNTSGNGAYLENDYTSATPALTLIGAIEFNANGNDGLEVYTKSAITLTDVDAIGNMGDGAYLNNTAGTVAAAVTLANTNVFSENGNNGLEVHTNGAITANNLVDNANSVSGAWLDNCGYNAYRTCTTSTVAPVTVSGTNQFKSNSSGLAVFSNGLITLSNITASNNKSGSGVQVNNTHSPTFQGVTIAGTNFFSENASAGLLVYTSGPVTANNLTAFDNGFDNGIGDPNYGYGVDIENWTAATAQPVNLTGTNSMTYNFLKGLNVLTRGAITINNLTVSNNEGFGSAWGAWLDSMDYTLPSAPQNVTITGYANFNNNDAAGLYIWAYGTISLNNVTANGNGLDGGVYLDNCNYNNGLGHCTATSPKAVTLTGNNSFEKNSSFGLTINSLGAITVNNINADGNTLADGADLDNDFPGAVGGVSVTNTATYSPSFNNNGGNGLEVDSRGAITVMDLNATGNNNDGVYLKNSDGTGNISLGTARVGWVNSLSGNGLNHLQAGNGWDGLEVYSKGSVALSNITASSNGSYDAGTDTYSGEGVHIDNTAGVAGVTLTGTNVTNFNWTNGLDVASNGAISINNLTANNNGYFDTLTDIQDDAVNGYGTSLDNSSVSTAQPITLTGTNQFNNNMYDGLDVFSNGGAVTLNNLTANGNGLAYDPDPNTNPDSSGYGVLVDNTSSGTVGQNVTISGTNQFNNNWLDGLDVYSYGNLALNNVTANSNGQGTYVDYGFGAFLDNCMFSGTGTCAIVTPTTVTLTGANQFNNNGDDGLRVFSKGAITLNGLTANGNGLAHDPDPNTNPHSSGFGVYVDNTYSGTAVGQNVTLTGTDVFNNNWLDGLDIYSYGIIALNGVTASDNGQGDYDGYGSGAWLDNCNSKDGGITCQTVTPKTVTLTGNNQFSNNNGNDGLDVFSKGAITVNNVNADNNGNYGAFLENDFTGALGGVSVNNTAVYLPSFNDNGNNGLEVYSLGTITVMDLDATGNNSGDGVYLDNSNGSGNVSLGTARVGWSNDLSSNWVTGLEVYSNGSVTLTNIEAENNELSFLPLPNRRATACILTTPLPLLEWASP